MTTRLISEIPPTYLPESSSDTQARADLTAGGDPQRVVRDYPQSPWAWGVLAMRALDDNRTIEAYAYARTGYHLGLDSLRRSGWRDGGVVPPGHPPNQGFLLALDVLATAARALGQAGEANQLDFFLRRCDPDHLSF